MKTFKVLTLSERSASGRVDHDDKVSLLSEDYCKAGDDQQKAAYRGKK